MKKSQVIIVLVLIFIISTALGVGGAFVVKNMQGAGGTGETMGAAGPSLTVDNRADKSSNVQTTQSVNVEETKPATSEVAAPTEVNAVSQEVVSVESSTLLTTAEDPISATNAINSEKDKLSATSQSLEINLSSEEIMIEELDGPNPDPKNRTYSFSVMAYGGRGDLIYYLYPAKNAKDTLKNATGEFTEVKPIPTGKYVLLIKDQYGKEVVKEITGFVTILKQLTAQELTKRISTSVPDKDLEKYFAKNYSVKFDGIKSGDPVPTSYTQIYSNIASGYWSRVKVTSVEFNDYNKITKIRFNVYYN